MPKMRELGAPLGGHGQYPPLDVSNIRLAQTGELLNECALLGDDIQHRLLEESMSSLPDSVF